jgi:hypothetical protein
VEGFEPPNGGTKTRCLTTWRHPMQPEVFVHNSCTEYIASSQPLSNVTANAAAAGLSKATPLDTSAFEGGGHQNPPDGIWTGHFGLRRGSGSSGGDGHTFNNSLLRLVGSPAWHSSGRPLEGRGFDGHPRPARGVASETARMACNAIR